MPTVNLASLLVVTCHGCWFLVDNYKWAGTGETKNQQLKTNNYFHTNKKVLVVSTADFEIC